MFFTVIMQDDAETTKQKYNVQAAEVKDRPWLDAVTSHFTGKKSFFQNWQTFKSRRGF